MSRNITGAYIVDGTPSIGTLYTGNKTLQNLIDNTDFEIVYEWQHLRTFGKIFDPHARLDGKIITNQNWQTILANTTTPWLLAPYFYPQDHKGCICRLKAILT